MANELIDAIERGDIDMVNDTRVEDLLDDGVNPNFQDNHGDTGLIAASSDGYIYIVRLLLERGALPNIQNKYGFTALMGASYSEYINIVELLLEYGADPNIQDNNGDTALSLALDHDRTDIAQILQDHINVTKIQRSLRKRNTNRKIRTFKNRQNLAFSKSQDMLNTILGRDMPEDLYMKISKHASNIHDMDTMHRGQEQEQDEQEQEQDEPYMNWLQERRSQSGSGKHRRSRNRRRY